MTQEWVSGPACVYVFREAGRMLYLFGDVHFSYGNMCRQPVGATTFNAFVDRLMSAERETRAPPRLVVEYPYSTPAMMRTARGRWYLKRIEQALSQDSSASARLGTVLYRLFGVSGPVTGMLGKLYSEYPETSPQVICGDIRSEPNVHAWTLAMSTEGVPALERVRRKMTDAGLRRWLNAYLKSNEFWQDVRDIFATTLLDKYFVKSRGTHVMRRAWLSLKPGDRRRVAAFHSTLIDEVVKTRHTDLRMWVETTQAMLMDTYVIVQTLAAAPADVIVYAGAYHTQHYREFFAAHGRRCKLLHAHDMQTSSDGDVERCVPVPIV